MWHRRPRTSLKLFSHLLGIVVGALLFNSALAATNGFSGGVTPSRFELAASQGDVVRKSLKIYNLSARPQQFAVRTVDWRYSENGEISFHDELEDNSCREWVRLERHKISVIPDPQRPRSFRFEVAIPEPTAPRECRFALMIENLDGDAAANFASGTLKLPIAGRIAVIVYVGVGDVEPNIEVRELSVRTLNKRNLPAVEVENQGSAHGRLDADLIARNNDGTKTPLNIATSPILPGQTRFMQLQPTGKTPLSYPLTITGKIYSDGQTITINQQLLSANQSLLAEK